MRKTEIYVAQIPAVSREYALDLDRRFRAIEIKPGVTHDEIMFNAGMRKVIEFILNNSVKREISGDPTEIRNKHESMLERVLGKLKFR